MTTIEFIVIFYWIFSSIAILAYSFKDDKVNDYFDYVWNITISFIYGWLMLPILLGKKL